MDGEANLGLNKLAQVMQERMNRNQDANNGALILDFGTIQPDMSLKTNTFAIPIPQTDYHVCRQLTLGPTHNILAKTQDIGKPHSGSHIHNTHSLTCSSHGGSGTGTTGEARLLGGVPQSAGGAHGNAGGQGHLLHGRGHRRGAGPTYPVQADGGRRQP